MSGLMTDCEKVAFVGLSPHLNRSFEVPVNRLDNPQEQLFTLGMVNGLLGQGELFLKKIKEEKEKHKNNEAEGAVSSGIQWPLLLAHYAGHVSAFAYALQTSEVDWHSLEPWQRAQIFIKLKNRQGGWSALSDDQRIELIKGLVDIEKKDAMPASGKDAELFAKIFTFGLQETRPVFRGISTSLRDLIEEDILKHRKPVDMRFAVNRFIHINRRLIEKEQECLSFIESFEWLTMKADPNIFQALAAAGADAITSLKALKVIVSGLSRDLGNAYMTCNDVGVESNHFGFNSWQDAGYSDDIR